MNRFYRALRLMHVSKRIGIRNVVAVIWYRLQKTSGYFRLVHPIQDLKPAAIYFDDTKHERVTPSETCHLLEYDAEQLCDGRLKFYSHVWQQLGNPPDWFKDPITGKEFVGKKNHWSAIDDFDQSGIDIKNIWEPSRFGWVVSLALAYRKSGELKYVITLNRWLADWVGRNPVNQGPNWKCGQETSIRLMNLATAALILEQADQPTVGLRDLLEHHLHRIASTLRYAMAQDNNHGTSEAAALYIGGSWLSRIGVAKGQSWELMGRSWLENRARRLIGNQGTFSQYSLNYQRLLLDTLSIVEIWRRHHQRPAFSEEFMHRLSSATEWLRHMVSPTNGDGPNVGANDGAHLLQWTNTPYRDYRPTVQLASALFTGRRVYESGPWDYPFQLLGIDLPEEVVADPGSFVAADGGFAVFRRGAAMAMLRYPQFKFRPGQADALHLDLWLGGVNLLRDGGSYSYNTDRWLMDYFGGVESHNTVQFDGREQMPRLSRFLFDDWLKTDFLEPLFTDGLATRFSAGYTDGYGAVHRRHIDLRESQISVEDQLSHFKNKAVLRWRLCPGHWLKKINSDGVTIHNKELGVDLKVTSSVPVVRTAMVEGWESRHYQEKTSLPVIEIEVHQSATIITEIRWAA